MKEQEKLFFKSLCKFRTEKVNANLAEFATPSVLGHLFFNRMQGIAYDMLKKSNLLGKVNREFRNSLDASYEQNKQRNNSYLSCVDMVSKILSGRECKVAMLKGAYLCAHYPEGYRTSNDIDLLVNPEDVTTVGQLLVETGFEQGNIKNGEFVPATRREVIESKMMRGETVPYIMEVNLPFMKFLEVDINFSLDYKPGDTYVLSDMLSHICVRREKRIHVPTLNTEDFFIHLCSHLYKEATTFPWIEMKRDMTLYKYCDIYFLLDEMSETDLNNTFTRAKELGMDKICAYAVLEAIDLFDMNSDNAKMMAEHYLSDAPKFLLQVTSPKDNKIYQYKTRSATERFFMRDRVADLKEVSIYENT